MNNENNQQMDQKEGVIVSSIVPAGWKLWALLFRAIAEGHLDELEQDIDQTVLDYLGEEWSLEASFSDAVRGLYVETCNDTRRKLPVEIYDLESPKEALSELKDVAKGILDWYTKSRPFIEEDTVESQMFARVADNCRIVIQLLDSKPDVPQDTWEEYCPYWLVYFTDMEKRSWFKIVNGRCIEQMEYDDFCHALECDGVISWTEYADADAEEGVFHEKDCRNIKVSPIKGYGMAVFGFLLLLLTKRSRKEFPKYGIDENDEFFVESVGYDALTAWADLFQNRIDWGKDYNLREDSWKEGYYQSDEYPSFINSGISSDEMVLLGSLCRRSTFENIVGAEALDQVIAGNLSAEPVVEQYRFLYEKRDELGTFYPLLVRELEYLYQNIDDIVECFYDEKKAEKNKNEYSKWRFEMKQCNGKVIDEVYAGLRKADVYDLHELFFERSQLAYEYLWQLPLVHSGMVKRYLQECIVQDEKLLTIIKRKLDDTPLQQAIDKEMARKTGKQDRVEKAKAELRAKGIIDDRDTIRKTDNYSKLIDLVRVLISRREDDKKEFARPVRGWKPFIEEEKLKSIPQSDLNESGERVMLIDSDNKFTDAFYGLLPKRGYNYARLFLNGIDWALYDDVFRLDGNLLKGEDLKKAIGSRKDLYVDIIKDIIRKYEMMDNDSFARITRKK